MIIKSPKFMKEAYSMALNYQMLGRRLHDARTARKLSQFQLADIIGASPTFISRIECGAKGPGLETLIQLADALQVSIDALLTESRAYIPESKPDKLSECLEGCSAYERYVILQTMKELKSILKEGRGLNETSQRV